jgi:hypothetical protein
MILLLFASLQSTLPPTSIMLFHTPKQTQRPLQPGNLKRMRWEEKGDTSRLPFEFSHNIQLWSSRKFRLLDSWCPCIPSSVHFKHRILREVEPCGGSPWVSVFEMHFLTGSTNYDDTINGLQSGIGNFYFESLFILGFCNGWGGREGDFCKLLLNPGF